MVANRCGCTSQLCLSVLTLLLTLYKWVKNWLIFLFLSFFNKIINYSIRKKIIFFGSFSWHLESILWRFTLGYWHIIGKIIHLQILILSLNFNQRYSLSFLKCILQHVTPQYLATSLSHLSKQPPAETNWQFFFLFLANIIQTPFNLVWIDLTQNLLYNFKRLI